MKIKPTLSLSNATSEHVIPPQNDEFLYLDEENIRKKVLDFSLPHVARTQFYIPSIHCASCMKILESLNRTYRGIIKSEVNFVKKVITIDFNPQKIKLSQIASLLTSAGYRPTINSDSGKKLGKKKQINSSLIQLAVAGFCFGNIMLFSFPEYLGINETDAHLQVLFSYLNIMLSIPVLLYSAKDYFIATWKSFHSKRISIDTPIAIGIITLFLRSMHDILWQGDPGYLDSMSGLIFFLLIGKWFQSKTYESLKFDRDYHSYFPLAVYKKTQEDWSPTVVHELQPGDHIRIRNREIVPTDSLLLDTHAHIDYSFVTGESTPTPIKIGGIIYAGGRLVGAPAIMKVEKKTSQSHLTSLWNSNVFAKSESGHYKTLIDKVAKKFTVVILGIALGTALYWSFVNPTQLWLSVTSVLIVACPCALALAAPFTYGSALRALGRHGFYLKNAEVVEKIACSNAIIFDKTGTLTQAEANVHWVGKMNQEELLKVKKLASSSTHPLSVLVSNHIIGLSTDLLTSYKEWPGKGIEGVVDTTIVKLGSDVFVGAKSTPQSAHSKIHISIDGEVRGYFTVTPSIRKGVKELIEKLGEKVIALLSGDGKGDWYRMKALFSSHTTLRFNQTPHDKLNYISMCQKKGKKVIMVGDGLNDSGALKQSDVGIAITDNTGIFTPTCDAMLDGSKLTSLNDFLMLAKSALLILKISLAFSFVYNALGITFAAMGHLTPLLAAILMPISSILVVTFTTLAVRIKTRQILP